MPISEPPRSIPPIPPDQRPARLLTIDTKTFSRDGIYVNSAYEWLHQVAKRERELDAEVIQLIVHEVPFSLILLQAPMLVVCTSTSWSFRMMAGILHGPVGGLINGWMVASHAEGRETFDMLTNPERALEPIDPDEADWQDEG